MPKKPSGNFDQNEYIKAWAKENMKSIKAKYRSEFVDSFREACLKLGVSQSQVLKQAMQETIDKANQLD